MAGTPTPTSWHRGTTDRAASGHRSQEGNRTQVLAAVRLDATAPAGSDAGRATASSAGWVARARAWAGGSAWAPLAGKLAGYVAGFVALALVGSGAASWRLGAAGGALAMGLGPASPPPASSEGAPPPAVAAAQMAGGHADDEHGHEPAHGAGDAHGASDAGAPDATVAVDGGAATGGVTADGKVVLNAATEEDLRRLPGVGPSKARAIVALRTKLGKFKRAEDLLRVKGIGRRSLARMRPLLLVDVP